MNEEIEKIALEIIEEWKNDYNDNSNSNFIKNITNLIDQNTKPLIDEIAKLKAQFEQSDKMYSDLLAKKDYFKFNWENAEGRIKQLQSDLKAADSVNEQNQTIIKELERKIFISENGSINCSHDKTVFKHIRCNVCEDCGHLVEIDV